jgi:hypothetical protein
MILKYTSYLEGKLTIELGKDLIREFIVNDLKNQNINDIKKWKRDLYVTLPTAYKELCPNKLFIKRHYINLNQKFYNPEWVEIKDI